MEEATNGVYTTKFTLWPTNWINNKHRPVVIEINCDHYVVAFGTATTHKRNGSVAKKYFMVTDNGQETSQYGYKPYMKYYNGWNLHYGLDLK